MYQSALVMILATVSAFKDPIQQLKDSAQDITSDQLMYVSNKYHRVDRIHINIPGASDRYGNMVFGHENKAVNFTDNYYAHKGYTAKLIRGKNLWVAQNDGVHFSNFASRNYAVALRVNDAGTGMEAAFISYSQPLAFIENDQVSMTLEAAQKLGLKSGWQRNHITAGLFDNPWVSMKDQSGLLVSEQCSYVLKDETLGPLLKEKSLGIYKEDGVYKIKLSQA